MSVLDQIDTPEPAGGNPGGQLVPSSFQEAIYQAGLDTQDNLLIEAVAGSGKSSTLRELSRRLRGSILYTAFNKAIAEDMIAKGISGDVKTFNGLGHGIMMRNRPRAKLDARKVPGLIKKIMGDSTEHREHGYSIARAVGLGKGLGLGLAAEPTADDFQAIIDDFGFDIPVEFIQDASVICREAFEQSRLDEQTFDFDDQLWVPISQGWAFPGYDNLLVDEDQDLNPIQHAMIAAMRSRLIAVGDRHQAIYGFRGACADSTDLLKQQFAMREFPLSICYRCSQSVVLAAQDFCKTIQWREGAPQGEITWANEDPGLFSSRHMILCRTNAPLFRAIMAKVRAKEPCQVLSSFLDSFYNFIRGFKAQTTADLRPKLDHWYEKEREACKTRTKLATLTDKYQTAMMLAKEYRTTQEILNLLDRLKDSRQGPIFATIHKAKGLEHPHVYILRPELLGGFGEMTAEQAQQEQNLHYVAITRAKETLTYGAKR
jgi:hypothetical protein